MKAARVHQWGSPEVITVESERDARPVRLNRGRRRKNADKPPTLDRSRPMLRAGTRMSAYRALAVRIENRAEARRQGDRLDRNIFCCSA